MGKKDQKSRFETREYTQEDFSKDQRKQYFDGVVNKFLIQTDQYKPMRGTQCKPEKLLSMVQEREKAMLDLVLNTREIKQKVLVQDAVYTWIMKNQAEEVVGSFKQLKKKVFNMDWTMEFRSNGKVKTKDKEQGYWYMFNEHELLFQVNDVFYWMKYLSEKDVWTVHNPWSSDLAGHEMRLKNPAAQKGNVQQSWQSQNHKLIETKLQTNKLTIDEKYREMMKCKIDYLPQSPTDNQENELKTNYIVKRIFTQFQLVLQIWKNEINVKQPDECRAEMLHQSIVNEVSGIETDPNFIWFTSTNQKVYWFTIEQNWIEDSTEVYLNTYNLESELADKKLIRQLNNNFKHGMLHSVHFGKPYQQHIFQQPLYDFEDFDYRNRFFHDYVILIYANNWIEICGTNLESLVESVPYESGQSQKKASEIICPLPIKDIRPDLKFDFNQPPILHYEVQSEESKWIYINLGNKSEIICSVKQGEGLDGQKIEVLRGLKKHLDHKGGKDKSSAFSKDIRKDAKEAGPSDKTASENQSTSGILKYKKELKRFDDRVKLYKYQSTTYQEYVAQNQGPGQSSLDVIDHKIRGLDNSSCLRTRLDKYKAVKHILQNLSARLPDCSLNFNNKDFNKGVSIFFCYVGRPYMQVIQPIHEVEGEICHKLLHFDISSLVQNLVMINEQLGQVPIQKVLNEQVIDQQTLIVGKEPLVATTLEKEHFEYFQAKYKGQNLILNKKLADLDSGISKNLVSKIYHFGDKTNELRTSSSEANNDFTQASHADLFEGSPANGKNSRLQFTLKEDQIVLEKDQGYSSMALNIILPKTMDVRDFGDTTQAIIFQTSGSIRFVVLDTVKLVILEQLKIQKVKSRFEQNQDNPLHIEFCQSSEKIFYKNKLDPRNKQLKDDTEVRYQIISYDRHVQMAMVDEISLKTTEEWDFSYSKQYTKTATKIQRTGMKFILVEPIDEVFMTQARDIRSMSILPLYTEDLVIVGTMIQMTNLTFLLDESNDQYFRDEFLSISMKQKKSHIFKLPNDDFMFDNQKLTRSGIREFKAAENTLIAEVQVSELIQNTYDYFSEREILKILYDQLVNVLNTVTFNFVGILERDQSQIQKNSHSTLGYNGFKPLQIFGGKSLVYSKLKKPDKLRNALDGNLKSQQKFVTYNQSALERYLQVDGKLQQAFIDQGVLSDPKNKNISLDIQQISILEQAMELEQFNSVRIIIDYMYEREMGSTRYDMMMGTLLLAIEKEFCSYYIPFFTKQVDSIEDVKLFNKLNMEVDIQDDQFERFCEKALIVDQIVNDGTSLDCNNKVYEKMNEMDLKYCQNLQLFEVDHMYIDLRPCILYQKEKMLTEVSLKDCHKIREAEFTNFDTAKLMREITNQIGSNIEDTQVLRNVIDYQFELHTYRYFIYMWAIFFTTYILPFLIQIFVDKYEVILVCNIICIISQLFFFLVEMIQLKDQGKMFFQDTWNRIEITMFGMNIVYFVIRLQHLDDSFSPLNPAVSTKEGILVPMVLLNLALVTFCIMKMMFYLRVYPSFGSMVKLLFRVFVDIYAFTVFLIMWIAFFGLCYLIIGLEIPKEDYHELNRFVRSFIQAYRNSIGDLAPPTYEIWMGLDISIHWKNIMEIVIWLIWFLNQWIVLIILLNFLIAIVSQSYEVVMTQEILNRYLHRCELNRECFLIMRAFNLLENYNTLIVYSKWETIEDNNSEWLGFVTAIKTFIVKTNGSMTQKFSKMVDSQMKGMNFKIDHMQAEHKSLNMKIQDVKDDTREISKEVHRVASSVDDIKKMLLDFKNDQSKNMMAKREPLGEEPKKKEKTKVVKKVPVASEISKVE